MSNKIKLYTKTIGLSMLIGLSSCQKKTETQIGTSTQKLISMLERGDRESVKVKGIAPNTRILTSKEIKTHQTNDSIGETYYRVYAGKADKKIRQAQGKKETLVTVGQGVTGLNYIKLAGNKKAYEGDYISSQMADSLYKANISQKDSILKANIPDSSYVNLKQHEKDAVISYLYNVSEKILKKAPKGKSFFQFLSEKKLGQVQSKFNVAPSSETAAAGIAKRNLVNMIIFGNGKIYDEKMAQENFQKQVKIIINNSKGKDLLEEAISISKKYNVDDKNLKETEEKIKNIVNNE